MSFAGMHYLGPDNFYMNGVIKNQKTGNRFLATSNFPLPFQMAWYTSYTVNIVAYVVEIYFDYSPGTSLVSTTLYNSTLNYQVYSDYDPTYSDYPE